MDYKMLMKQLLLGVLQLLYEKSLPADLALGKESHLQVWLG